MCSDGIMKVEKTPIISVRQTLTSQMYVDSVLEPGDNGEEQWTEIYLNMIMHFHTNTRRIFETFLVTDSVYRHFKVL